MNNETPVKVVVRVRPLNEKETEEGQTKFLSVARRDSGARIEVQKGDAETKHYSFDKILDEGATHNDVFENTAAGLADDLIHGNSIFWIKKSQI